jgi:phage N-6-adenine-methyltransferase
MLNQGLFSSEKQDWCTPQQFFDELDAEFHFVLDAAATHQNSKCKRCFTPEDDGLIQNWDMGGAVYCNPPYGKEIGLWVKKAYEEAQKGTTIVMLIPARTDTKYFHEYIYHKAEIRFVKGRLKFTDENGTPKGTAPFPSMVVIYNRKDNQ